MSSGEGTIQQPRFVADLQQKVIHDLQCLQGACREESIREEHWMTLRERDEAEFLILYFGFHWCPECSQAAPEQGEGDQKPWKPFSI